MMWGADKSEVSRSWRRDMGFTLIQLLVAMTVSAILAVFAIPDLRAYVQNTRTATAVNDFTMLIHDARNEAISGGGSITICPSSDGFTCSGDWADGLLSFVDLNGNRVRETTKGKKFEQCNPDTDDCVVRQDFLLDTDASFSNVAGNLSIQFLPTGFLNGAAETFELCVDGAAQGRQIRITAAGQVRIAALDC